MPASISEQKLLMQISSKTGKSSGGNFVSRVTGEYIGTEIVDAKIAQR